MFLLISFNLIEFFFFFHFFFMNGQKETKEISLKLAKEINDSIEMYKNMQFKPNDNEEKRILENKIENQFSSIKGLLSVLRTFKDDDEAKNIVLTIENQENLFKSIILKQNQNTENIANEHENEDYLHESIQNMGYETAEIDNLLSEHIETLRDLEEIQTEGINSLSILSQRVKKINKDLCKLFIFVVIAIVLLLYLRYLYDSKT